MPQAIEMVWNTDGSDDKRLSSEIPQDELDATIKQIEQFLKLNGADRASLIDLKGQGNPELTDKDNGLLIARKLGYTAGTYLTLDSKRLEKIGRGGGELLFVANDTELEGKEIDLGERRALDTKLHIGKYGLRVVTAYLDDTNEDERNIEVDALLAHLNREDMPTALHLDGNDLRPNMQGAGLWTKTKDLGVRAAVHTVLPAIRRFVPDKPGTILHELNWLAETIPEMNRREAIAKLLEAGYIDGDPEKRPTAPAKLRLFGVDYVLHNDKIKIDNLELIDPKGFSRHMALRFRSSQE